MEEEGDTHGRLSVDEITDKLIQMNDSAKLVFIGAQLHCIAALLEKINIKALQCEQWLIEIDKSICSAK